jgi:outer membrane protein
LFSLRADGVHLRYILRSSMAALAALLACSQSSGAEAPCTSPSSECAVVGRWEITASLGLGSRSNPIAGKSDLPLVVIPRISYYGKRFFLENLDLGFTLHEGVANTFNLIASPGYDRAFFVNRDLQNIFVPGGSSFGSGTVNAPAADRVFEVSPRHTTYLAGPEWTFSYGAVTGQLDALREITGEHDGYEVRAALATPLLEGARGSLVASAGLTWKSAEVVRYYYGVTQLYEPGSALNPFVRLRYARPLSDRWTLNAFAHYEVLSNAIARSPVVTDDHVTTVFAGVVFRVH